MLAGAVSLRCSGEDPYRLPITVIAANGATPAMTEHLVLSQRALTLAASLAKRYDDATTRRALATEI